MAITDINMLKGWFENGDYPNQEQFWAWMDSYWHKSEAIPIEIITGLTALLAGKATQQDIINLQSQIDSLQTGNAPIVLNLVADGTYTIPDGKLLEKIAIVPTADILLGVGNAADDFSIWPPMNFAGGQASILALDLYANGNRTIYFNGISAPTTLKIYNR